MHSPLDPAPDSTESFCGGKELSRGAQFDMKINLSQSLPLLRSRVCATLKKSANCVSWPLRRKRRRRRSANAHTDSKAFFGRLPKGYFIITAVRFRGIKEIRRRMDGAAWSGINEWKRMNGWLVPGSSPVMCLLLLTPLRSGSCSAWF